jgi:hypothetical protein
MVLDNLFKEDHLVQLKEPDVLRILMETPWHMLNLDFRIRPCHFEQMQQEP